MGYIFYNTVEDLKSYLVAGCEKKTFGPETDRMVEKLKPAERITQIKDFNELFKKSLTKLVKHKDIHPAYDYYKAARIFDQRQLPSLSHNIDDYSAIPEMNNVGHGELLEEFQIYANFNVYQGLPSTFDIRQFWLSPVTIAKFQDSHIYLLLLPRQFGCLWLALM